jgi:hypothetical protein
MQNNITTIKGNVSKNTNGITNINNRLTTNEGNISNLNNEISNVDNRVTLLESIEILPDYTDEIIGIHNKIRIINDDITTINGNVS